MFRAHTHAWMQELPTPGYVCQLFFLNWHLSNLTRSELRRISGRQFSSLSQLIAKSAMHWSHCKGEGETVWWWAATKATGAKSSASVELWGLDCSVTRLLLHILGMRKTSSPHQGVGVNYMAISGTSLQIKLQLTFSGVKRCVFASTVSATGLQQDKKCTHDVHLSHKSVTVKWFQCSLMD